MVFNNLGADTHTHTHTQTNKHGYPDKINFKKPGMPGLKSPRPSATYEVVMDTRNI